MSKKLRRGTPTQARSRKAKAANLGRSTKPRRPEAAARQSPETRRRAKPAAPARVALPYKKFQITRGKKKSYGYVSTITGKRISSKIKTKDRKLQALREIFPAFRSQVQTKKGSKHKTRTRIVRRSDKTLRKISRTIAEYKQVGFNPLEASPSLGRYFDWLKKNKPETYRAAVRAARLEGNVEDLTPHEIDQSGDE